jgi:hypothetical protein
MHTRPNRPHQKKKKRPVIVNRSDMVAKTLSTNVSVILMELVYIQKMDKSSLSWVFHIIPIIWAFHFFLILDILHQCPTAKHKQPNNLVNRKEGIHKFQ